MIPLATARGSVSGFCLELRCRFGVSSTGEQPTYPRVIANLICKRRPSNDLNQVHRVFLFVLLSAVISITAAPATLAQDSNQPTQTKPEFRHDEINLDAQLYLILATNRDVEEGAMPLPLGPIVKQLRESLTFKHYALAATLLNRVSSGGRLEVSWVGGPFLVPSSPMTTNPSFSQFTAGVKVFVDESGREVVRLNDFRFGTRVPVVVGQAGPTAASTSGTPLPVITYEPVGLRTDISIHEGAPVVAGTLNMGPSGDALIVVIAARRAN